MGRMSLNFWSTPAHAIVTMLAGWIHREQEAVVAYQKEEIRALREMLGGGRLRFTDAQHRRLESDPSASVLPTYLNASIGPHTTTASSPT